MRIYKIASVTKKYFCNNCGEFYVVHDSEKTENKRCSWCNSPVKCDGKVEIAPEFGQGDFQRDKPEQNRYLPTYSEEIEYPFDDKLKKWPILSSFGIKVYCHGRRDPYCYNNDAIKSMSDKRGSEFVDIYSEKSREFNPSLADYSQIEATLLERLLEETLTDLNEQW